MAAKKKTKNKATKSKITARKKAMPMKMVKRPKKLARTKPASKKAAKKKVSRNKQPRKKSGRPGALEFSTKGPRSHSGEQSGDFQGLSRLEAADSESVEELLEEGNAFEADVVAGVEHADEDQEREVHTHEVPEDDVPEEYLDKE